MSVSARLRVPAPCFSQDGGLRDPLYESEATDFVRGPAQAAGPPGKEGGPGQQPPAMEGSFWRPECFLPGGGGPSALGRTALAGPGKFSSPG